MKIRLDENGSIRLESNAPLSAEMLARIEKRLINKKATLEQMNKDYDDGKFDDIFKKL